MFSQLFKRFHVIERQLFNLVKTLIIPRLRCITRLNLDSSRKVERGLWFDETFCLSNVLCTFYQLHFCFEFCLEHYQKILENTMWRVAVLKPMQLYKKEDVHTVIKVLLWRNLHVSYLSHCKIQTSSLCEKKNAVYYFEISLFVQEIFKFLKYANYQVMTS